MMGGIHRLKKQLTKPIRMAATGVVFNSCQVFMAAPVGKDAKKLIKGFQDMMSHLTHRSSVPNMQDFYAAHFKLLDGMKEKALTEN